MVRNPCRLFLFCVCARQYSVCRLHHGHNKHDNAKSGRCGRASAQNLLGDRQPPQAIAVKEPSAVDLCLRYQTSGGLQERKLGHLSAVLGVGCKLRHKDCGTRRPIRRCGGVLLVVPTQGTTTNNRPAPQQGTNVTKFYCFYFVHIAHSFPIHSKRFLSCGLQSNPI